MFILKKGHQPGVYVPLRALFLVLDLIGSYILKTSTISVGISNFRKIRNKIGN